MLLYDAVAPVDLEPVKESKSHDSDARDRARVSDDRDPAIEASPKLCDFWRWRNVAVTTVGLIKCISRVSIVHFTYFFGFGWE